MITAAWGRQSLVSWSAHHLKITSSLKTWRAAIDTWKYTKNNLSLFGMTVFLEMNFALKINDEYCEVWGIFKKCSWGLSLPCKPVDSPHKLIRARQLWSLTSPAGTKDQISEFWDRLELFCYILCSNLGSLELLVWWIITTVWYWKKIYWKPPRHLQELLRLEGRPQREPVQCSYNLN